MKIKIRTVFPKKTIDVENVYFSSDLHLNHQRVIDFGRNFKDVEEMNSTIINNINNKVFPNDLLVLLGDTLMIEKDYLNFINSLNCNNIIILYGNHCTTSKLEYANSNSDKLIYIGHYLELSIGKQFISCSHYPMIHWNYQEDNAIHLHGHLHADESDIVKEIHKYKSMDVGVDFYYKLYGKYDIFSFEEITHYLKDKLVTKRH